MDYIIFNNIMIIGHYILTIKEIGYTKHDITSTSFKKKNE